MRMLLKPRKHSMNFVQIYKNNLENEPAPYWLGRYQYNVTGWDKSHGLPALSRVWQHIKLSDFSLGTRPRDSLVVDEDIKKPNQPTNQTNKVENSARLRPKIYEARTAGGKKNRAHHKYKDYSDDGRYSFTVSGLKAVRHRYILFVFMVCSFFFRPAGRA